MENGFEAKNNVLQMRSSLFLAAVLVGSKKQTHGEANQLFPAGGGARVALAGAAMPPARARLPLAPPVAPGS